MLTLNGHFVSTQYFKRRRFANLVQRHTDGTATDTPSTTPASTAGVSNVSGNVVIVEGNDNNVVIANGQVPQGALRRAWC